MNRRTLAIVAIVMAALVASATPVATADAGLVVGSQHTTESEFDSGGFDGVYSNDGNVEYGHPSDGFENQAADNGIPDDWVPERGPDSVNVTTARAYSGTQSLYVSDSNVGDIYPESMPISDATTENVSVAVYSEDSGAQRVGISLWEQGANRLIIGMSSGDLKYATDSGWETIATEPDSQEWVHIELHAIDPSTDTVKVSWSASGGSGTSTINLSSDMVDGYDNVRVRVQDSSGYVDDFKPDAPATGTYRSQDMDVSDAEAAAFNLTLSDADATATVQEWTGSSWQDVNSSTWTTTGNHTLDISSATNSQLRTVVTLTGTGSNPTAVLHDESILFDASAPQADESTADPTDGEMLSDGTVNVSIDVSDGDFPTVQGDSVDATLYDASDDSVIGSETLTSNGTASVTWDAPSGTNTYYWTLEDDYGETSQTGEHSFSLPSTLYIRNETQPNDLIDGDATATVTFFSQDSVVERSTDDGTVDLSGLPPDEQFVAVVESDGYEPRRIIIDSLIEQQTAYLLPESANSARVVFKLDDSTGRFEPRTSELFVEKAITVNNSTEYRTIAADTFGSSGEFAVTLMDDTRYRLKVRNDQGETRVLGSYTTAGDDPDAVIPIAEVSIGGTSDSGATFDASIESADDQRYVRVTFFDPQEQTSEISFEVTNTDTGEVLRPMATETGTYGLYTENIKIPNGTDENASFVVNYSYVRSGEEVAGEQQLGDFPQIAERFNVDPQILSLLGWGSLIAVAGLVVILDPQLASLVTVMWGTLLTMLGVLGIPTSLLALGGGVAVLANIGRVR